MEKEDCNTLLIGGKEFVKDLKREEGIGYAILLKPREEESYKQAPMLEEVKEILD